MSLMQKPTPQEEKNFENWLEATNSDGLRAAIIKLRDAANAEVKVCPEVALRCFQEGRVQMAQNILELLPDSLQAVSAGAQSRSIQRRIALQKGEPVPTFGATSAGARNQNYLDDLRHDLQDEEFRFQYLAACATDSEGALRNGIKDVLEAALAAHDQKVRAALQWCLSHTNGHDVNCNLNQQSQWDEAQQALSDCANTPEVRQGEGEPISIAQAEINVKRNQCTCGYWEGLKRAEEALAAPAASKPEAGKEVKES